MSHSVVTENQNGNWKIFNKHAKNFVYFLSFFMKHPVDKTRCKKPMFKSTNLGSERNWYKIEQNW